MRMDKCGAVNWTIGRLIAVVLAIALLVIVVFGWNNAVVPLYERVEGRLNEVLILLNIRDGGDDFVECVLVIEHDCY